MKMKRFFAALTAAAMLCGLTACNTNNDSSDPGAGNSGSAGSTGDKKFVIGVCQQLEHAALDSATKGFSDVLKEKLGDNVDIQVQNAQNEKPACATIINNFVSANVDLIMANGTNALAAAVSGTGTIPIVGTSITSYDVALGEGWGGKNVTGASDLAPIAEQENMLVEIFPDAKKVGIMYCSGEENSIYQADLFAKALQEDGIEYKMYTVADSNEIQAQAQVAVGECDVIYIPTDNTLANAAETVRNVVVPAKIPVVAGEEGICSGCGTVTLSISYESMGRAAGEMAYEILVNGKNPGEMEVGYSETTKKYNAEICAELGITVPDNYIAIE